MNYLCLSDYFGSAINVHKEKIFKAIKALKPCLAFEYYLAFERILFYFVLFHVAKNRASGTKHGRLNEVLIHWKSKGEVFNANFASAVSEKSERASVASGLFS